MSKHTPWTFDLPKARTFLYGAALIPLGVILFYVAAFHDMPWGYPEDWGVFGDYAGGVMNPIFGYFSLIVLVMTLLTQTRELEAVRSNVRAERLLGFAAKVSEELRKALEAKAPIRLRDINRYVVGGDLYQVKPEDFREVPLLTALDCDAPGFFDRCVYRESLEAIMRPSDVSQWDFLQFGPLGWVLSGLTELNGLVTSLRVEDDSEIAAQFYVNRSSGLIKAVLILRYLSHSKLKNLYPAEEITLQDGERMIRWKVFEDGYFKQVD